jgi:hypothetical protein
MQFYCFMEASEFRSAHSHKTASLRGVWISLLLKLELKFSLCLTKHHAIKPYPLIAWAPHHEDVLGIGGIAPHILNLHTRWE